MVAAGPGGHDRNPVTEQERLVDIVGDEEHGLLVRAPDAGQLLLHDPAGLRIERAERLVHQQNRRIIGEDARDLQALAHAARKLAGMMVLEAFEPDQADILADNAPTLRPGDARACASRTRRSPRSSAS